MAGCGSAVCCSVVIGMSLSDWPNVSRWLLPSLSQNQTIATHNSLLHYSIGRLFLKFKLIILVVRV